MRSQITHFHLFCGSGMGAAGFQQAQARVGQLEAAMRCLGGIDSDPGACRDFGRFLGVEASCLDLFDEDQYRAFHRQPPPKGWREATPADVLAAAGGECPDIVFTSPPCKGFSGLLNPAAAGSARYQALNRLTVRGIQLMLEAFAERPPALVILENVPRIAQRGRGLLGDIRHELEFAGYRVAETAHDCGELGGLAQHRRRFLLVARHHLTIRPFLYQPPLHRVRGVGEVLGELPLPDDGRAGPMHRSPRLEWRTWLRLALIPAGGDWRSLQGMDVSALAVMPVRAWGGGDLGVTPWSSPAPTIAGESFPRNGAFSVADPRPGNTAEGGKRFNDIFRVVRWDRPAGAVTAGGSPSAGGQAVADPRPGTEWAGGGKYRVTAWGEAAGTVIGVSSTGNGAFSVGDSRPPQGVVDRDGHVYGVTRWTDAAETITARAEAGAGRFSVADPRLTATGARKPGCAFGSDGRYGVLPWNSPSRAVTGSACQDNGAWSVADPRPLPDDRERLVPLIIALDGTWHRPFTTLELAALQGFPVEDLVVEPLDGRSDTRWRLHIGNAVPRQAATAIGSVMAETILRARAGQVFQLDARPVWVRRLAAAVSVDVPPLHP